MYSINPIACTGVTASVPLSTGWDGILGVERSREQCEWKSGSQSERASKEVEGKAKVSLSVKLTFLPRTSNRSDINFRESILEESAATVVSLPREEKGGKQQEEDTQDVSPLLYSYLRHKSRNKHEQETSWTSSNTIGIWPF